MTATDRARQLAVTAAEGAAEKLAEDILAFDVSDYFVITDAFVLCSAPNDRQVRAIVDEVEERMRLAGAKPVRREGEREGRWVLLDYSDVIVHVQHAEERIFYALERLWKDCPLIELPADVRRGRSATVSEAGVSDMGRFDAGRFDPGRFDAGRFDSGRSDSGRSDSGRSDSGRPGTGS